MYHLSEVLNPTREYWRALFVVVPVVDYCYFCSIFPIPWKNFFEGVGRVGFGFHSNNHDIPNLSTLFDRLLLLI